MVVMIFLYDQFLYYLILAYHMNLYRYIVVNMKSINIFNKYFTGIIICELISRFLLINWLNVNEPGIIC
jgi:hypothetical protein